MSSIPSWFLFSQIFLAFIVASMAVAQWRTAHNKFVLDLFENRWRVYQDLRDFNAEYMKSPYSIDMPTIMGFHEVRTRARFLFGFEVSKALEEYHGHIIKMHSALSHVDKDDNDPKRPRSYRAKVTDEASEAMRVALTFSSLFEPYMAMRARRLRGPSEWFAHRNALRKSFGDQ